MGLFLNANILVILIANILASQAADGTPQFKYSIQMMKAQIESRNLPLLLAQARENVISHFRPLLHHFGLTEQQWRVLRILCEEREMEPRELCEICQILSPSMAGILKRLEEMGLILKLPVAADKRRLVVTVTAKSEALIQRMAPLVRQQYLYLEDAWGKELMNQLYETIEALGEKKDIKVKRVKLPAV